MQPRNLMEELVNMRVDELMDQENMCKCPQCRADVTALALNNLPPRYVTCIKGNVFILFEAQTPQERAQVASAIIRAAEIVRKNPRHEKAPLKLY
ncbi:MAG: late competence development ComFB family protein [Christensenellales bacterium]|jgi:competence protein ComFB